MVSKQVLVRLPDDLAERFAALVPSRKRSRFLVELLRQALDRESHELSMAAQRLTSLEAGGQLPDENEHWLESPLMSESAEFDAAEFERQFKAAQGSRERKRS